MSSLSFLQDIQQFFSTGATRSGYLGEGKTAFGGGCINNASWRLTNNDLPFGGIGDSGIGRYHGRYSFDTFSHKKAIMQTSTWFDPAFKYPPLKGKLKWLKRIMR